jgi:hypothetical protein
MTLPVHGFNKDCTLHAGRRQKITGGVAEQVIG